MLSDAAKRSSMHVYWLAEIHRILPTLGSEGTLFPIPEDWRSPFIGASPEQCVSFLNSLQPASTPEDEIDTNVLLLDHEAFVILDNDYQRNGQLTLCRTSFEFGDGSLGFVSLLYPARSATQFIMGASDDQWRNGLEEARNLAIRQNADKDDATNSRRRAEAKVIMQQEVN